MKKQISLILLILVFCLLSGCSTSSFMAEIPDHEFKRFEYHRAGNATSTHITATNAKRVGDKLEIESIKITADYGPFVSFNITLEGYKREAGSDNVLADNQEE